MDRDWKAVCSLYAVYADLCTYIDSISMYTMYVYSVYRRGDICIYQWRENAIYQN